MLPQLFRILKKKKAGDISLVMLLILISGLILWMIYGILKHDVPILVTNAFAVLLNICLLILSIVYKNR